MSVDKHMKAAYLSNSDTSEVSAPSTRFEPYTISYNKSSDQPYQGEGTIEKPYIIDWLPSDSGNPQNWSEAYKWFLTAFVCISTVGIAFCSSAYLGAFEGLMKDFDTSTEVVSLGMSLFVLGFGVGPLFWAPFSEVFGRRILFIITYVAMTAFNAGTAGAQNIATVILFRFFSGTFGASPLTNAGGTIADLFSARQRGLAISLFTVSPYMGPIIGPIVGGFTGDAAGWKWVHGVMAIFTCVILIVGIFVYPETYAPVLLRKRAEKLSKSTGLVYRSKFEKKNQIHIFHLLKVSLSRPWAFLFREPIVFLLSLYMAVVYGILYMLFAAYPLVYKQNRKWSTGISGLAFLGIAVGFIVAIIYYFFENRRYSKLIDRSDNGIVPPEARLLPAIIGAIALPIGLFWFAWTNSPSIHYMASISAGVPLGVGMILVFLGLSNYLIDTYLVYAASVLAVGAVLRALLAAIFSVFTSKMLKSLGIHWGSSIPGFLALACLPLPFIFWKYGHVIRRWSKYSSQAKTTVDQKVELNILQNPAEVKPAAGIIEEDKHQEELQSVVNF